MTNDITVTNFVTVYTTNAQPSIGGLDVVKQVNDFYTASFSYAISHILWLLGILITLLGIVVPVAYYYFQSRQLELKEQLLAAKLTAHIEEKISAFSKILSEGNAKFLEVEKNETNTKFDDLKKTMGRKISFALAGIFMVQGNFEHKSQEYYRAFLSYTLAIREFSEIFNLKNVQVNLREATKTLEHMDKTFFQGEHVEEIAKIKMIIDSVEKLDAKGLLDEDIKKFKNALARANDRE